MADNNKKSLELIFSLFLGLVIVSAFITALTYDFVSARTPIVILIPLLILCMVQIKRAWSASKDTDIKADICKVIRMQDSSFNSIAGFMAWMLVLLCLIFVAGHYAGIAAFMFMLLYMVSEEKLSISISIPVVVTLVIYVLFEHVFNIPLYRGMIYRVWAGYGIF